LIEDEYGEIYLTGTFSSTIDFDPGPGTTSLAAIGIEIFIAKYNLDGGFRWAHSISGDGWDFPGGLDISPSGEVLLVGATEQRTDFNIGTGTDTLPWNGNLSAFVARYDQCIAVYPDSQSICPDQTYTLGNQTLTGPGDYVQTVSLPGGCDSIVTLKLSTIPVDTGISLQGYDLVSSASGATYQWINCVTSQVIIGADSGTFTPSVPGDYAVVVTENGCSDTSACMTITTVGSTESIDRGLVRMYPNPVEDILHLEFPSPVKLSGIQLFDLTGRMLVSEQLQGASASWSLALREVPAGMYLVAVAYAEGSRQVGRVLVK
jgi:Secretion system C-terminal sorting domain